MSKITITNNSEPDTPSSGRTVVYSDATSKKLKSKDDTGQISVYGSPITSRGDVVIGDSSGFPSRLAVGTNGQVVSTDGVDIIWGAAPLSDPMTSRGDIIIRDSGNSLDRLAVGAANTVLKSDGLDPSWGSLGFADFDTDLTDTMAFVNGSVLDAPSFTVTSDGATVSGTIEKSGTGDIRVVFSTGIYTWDTTPAASVTLTAGTDSSPQINYLYLLESTKVYTASTSGWPSSGEYAPVATIVVPSATEVQANGTYKTHVWLDHLSSSTNNGHLAHVNEWIRSQHATWISGVSQTLTITTNGGGLDNVDFANSSGVILQLHDHAFPAFDTGVSTHIHVVNDNTTPYVKITDLNAALTDSTGTTMSGRRFSLVIWGVVSESANDSMLMVNLPSGSYNSDAGAVADNEKYDNYNIPSIYKGTGFLISRLVLRHQTSGNGTWTEISSDDLRGQFPSTFAGGSAGVGSEFSDTSFILYDNADNTKQLQFQASGITTATTRTLTSPDSDGTIALASGLSGGQTIQGDTASGGNLTLESTVNATKGAVISLDDFHVTTESADAVGRDIIIRKSRGATTAANDADTVGSLRMQFLNSATTYQDALEIRTTVDDVTDTTEDTTVRFYTQSIGVQTQGIAIRGAKVDIGGGDTTPDFPLSVKTNNQSTRIVYFYNPATAGDGLVIQGRSESSGQYILSCDHTQTGSNYVFRVRNDATIDHVDDANDANGPVYNFKQQRGPFSAQVSTADNDILGEINFNLLNDNATKAFVNVSQIKSTAIDITDTTEDGKLTFSTAGAGTLTEAMAIDESQRVSLKSFINVANSGEVVIIAGVITITGSRHTIDTEYSAPSDDLDTISGGIDGDIVILRAESDARTVTLKNGTGNLDIGADFALDNYRDTITLCYDSTVGSWLGISTMSNGV